MELSDLFGWQSAYNQNYNAMLSAYNSQAAYSGMQQDMQIAQAVQRAKDCEGCGAPLKTYIHHCEYCRRAA